MGDQGAPMSETRRTIGSLAALAHDTSASAISNASSITAMPCSTSATLVGHGGTTWTRLKCVNGHTPLALHAAARSFIGLASAPAALYGTSGSRVSRLR